MSQIYDKKSILVKVFEKFDFSKIFEKISILLKFLENSYVSKKFRFWSKFSINFDFTQIFEKISINVKIIEKKFDFVHNFRKFRKIPILLKLSSRF